MKQITLFIFLMAVQLRSSAQSFVTARFDLASIVSDTIYERAKTKGVMSLNENNNDFHLVVALGPLLTLHDHDSVAASKHRINLDFRGSFPVHNMSAYDSEHDHHVYSMPGKLAINGVTHNYTLRFELQKIISNTVDPRDVYGFPARISFSMEFYPADFGLHETAAYTQSIRVTAATEIINKIDPDASRQILHGNKAKKFSVKEAIRKRLFRKKKSDEVQFSE